MEYIEQLNMLLDGLKTILLGYYIYLPLVSTQGVFPKLENIGAFKPITTTPVEATCGSPERSVFCHSDINIKNIQTCTQCLCIQECPHRSKMPTHHQFLQSGLGSCVKLDRSNHHGPTRGGSPTSFIFYDHKDCFVAPSTLRTGMSFTLTVWVKPEREGVMCVIEKSADGQIVFKLTISEKETAFYYRTINGLQPPVKVMTQGRFLVKKWIHLCVQVHQIKISFFINGLEEDGNAFASRLLTDSVLDDDDSSIVLGQNVNGSEQFVGRMQDFRVYSVALSNREIMEVFSKELPYLHIQSECRCPSSHPRVHPLAQRFCIPNGVESSTRDKISRVNPDAHPVSYMNDNDLETTWISSLLPSSNTERGIFITLDLVNGQYQVFYVIIQFYSPFPQALKIQKKKDRDSPWEDWQYFSKDCSYFKMENNGVLKFPDSVNCQQLPRYTPFSRGNVTLSILTPEPNHRPGYNDFYNTRSLQEFVKVSQLRIHLFSQYYSDGSEAEAVNYRHRYHGISEITISGRCDCNGHADSCDQTVTPYRCLCDINSHTYGANCDRCLPLFNDKAFHQSDQVNAYNCRPCQCYNHATSCHYNAKLDPYLHDHDQGGGGVCDDCSHNTTGQHCQLCKDHFYRGAKDNLAAVDVCKPCACNEAGAMDKNIPCEQIDGQCKCKLYVFARQCDQCMDGYYNLTKSHDQGCLPCKCNIAGTLNGAVTCDQYSGQCKCKPNFTGLQCDRCNLRFKLQNILGVESCVPCQCNTYGSINQFCNPISGQCKCKADVKGLLCNKCPDNYYGPDAQGCKQCDCNVEGVIPGTICDAVTGQCACQPYTGGRQCNECVDGYYKVQQNDSISCLPCDCNVSGTINSSQYCDKSTGQCFCKPFVMGQKCNICISHKYNLSIFNLLGCRDCDCDPLGTLVGTQCDPISGQCKCLPNNQGRRCNLCKTGFYLSNAQDERCIPCSCHPTASHNETCTDLHGQCYCHDSSVTGQKCDKCKDFFFGFDPETGRCESCDCDLAGAINGSCDSLTGQCYCKIFVKGFQCDQCIEEAGGLNIQNPFGCSKTPYQQPPPNGYILNSTSIALSWNPPDSPNTNKITYELYRDGLKICQFMDVYPFSAQTFVDNSLLPYTLYSYHIVASNEYGSTSSDKVAYRTKAGTPVGDIYIYYFSTTFPSSISLNWTLTSNDSGPIETFRLIQSMADEHKVIYEGLDDSVTLYNLSPFTKYFFSVHACTTEGCLQSLPVTVVTPQAPPLYQSPPILQNSSSTSIYLQWSPPSQANGIVIAYELYMRGLLETTGDPRPPERRVFHTTGWLNPQPVVESENENALLPPATSAAVMNLEPNTEYEFSIVSTNMAGSAASEWVTLKTAESEPLFMTAPNILPLTSHSLNVTWSKPNNSATRGEVTGYTINVFAEDEGIFEVLYVAEDYELFYVATGLKPYHSYSFTITICNKVGCVTSVPNVGKTLAAAPHKLNAPLVHGINSTTMKVSWAPPVFLNGPFPTYQLERIDPALTITSATNFIKGTRFPGAGYFKFPPATFPMNTYFTGIKIQFRTKEPDGLILCAVSAGMQEEFVVLQIRNGRPYFLFDPQGSAVAISPTNDEGRVYNDNNWHEIIAVRTQASGTITVDGLYTGSDSATSGGIIIGEMTGIFVGGLPNDFLIQRNDKGNAQINRKHFVGCLGDVYIQRSGNPLDNWETLDWDVAEEKSNIHEKWEGCPETSEDGAHFLGFGFLELYPFVFSGGPSFEISFQFKTDQLKGLLLFTYNTDGPDYFIVQLNNGILSSIIRTKSTLLQLNLWAGLSYCDGRWNKVYIKKENTLFLVELNNLIDKVDEPDNIQIEIQVSSAVYIGGVPEHVQNSFPDLDLHQGFGGCIKEMELKKGFVVNFATSSFGAVRVYLDGCLLTGSSVNCRGNDSVIVYGGESQESYDNPLQPFTEYLYRVIASNEAGSEASSWSRGRTKSAVPQPLNIDFKTLNISGYSVAVTWTRPTGVKGIIEEYILKAYPECSPIVSAITATFPDAGKVNGTLKGLLPFTKYAVTLSICTLAGCREMPPVLSISTLQEVPEEVQPPIAETFPYSLHLCWLEPRKPNGIITQYILHMNGTQIYRGNGTEHNITSLTAFAPYHFLLTACTLVGCTNSSEITIFTAQLPPDYVAPPVLTVLDATKIFVQWREPKRSNGILERYILHITSNPKNRSCWQVIYNSSELFLDYAVQNLIPGTKYFIKLSACTQGGCTTSNVSVAITEESSPGGVQTPRIESHSAESFNISWSKPLHPNGMITSYTLYMDGILVQNSSDLIYFVDGLSPWSKHSFQLRVCTAKGCTLSKKVDANTQESEPEGNVLLHVIIDGPRGVQLKWQGPGKPNGQITYAVIFYGTFFKNEGNTFAVFNGQNILHRSQESNRWVFLSGLVPYSDYSIYINASNSKGFLISDPILITMPPAAPDGVLPPRLSSATPTSLQVVWSTPARNNAPGMPNYRLQMRSLNPTNEIRELYSGPSTSIIYPINDLQPFTPYDLRITASNAYGETKSNWTTMFTKEDKPGTIEPPVLTIVQSRSIKITWQPPHKPNGILTHYNIYQNGRKQVSVPGNSLSYTMLQLDPFTKYQFQIEGCTSEGCSLSLESFGVQTHPDAPSDIPPPVLHSDTSTSVAIQWQLPLNPNGVIENFKIERRLKGGEKIHTLVILPGNHPMKYDDQTSDMSPWTLYEYRISAATVNGGANSSTWSEVRTRPSRPAGMQAPNVTVLGPYTAKVTWRSPLIPNGEILSYEIRMPEPRIAIINTTLLSNTVTNLIPYTNYSVSIVACSGGGSYFGGCSESLPTYMTTHPTMPLGISPVSVTPISETFVVASWQPPSRPNGPNVRYELLRRKILQPLASNPPEDLNLWQNIYSGTQWFYEDKGLSRYTTYEYRLIVHNEVGYTLGTDVNVTTMAGLPIRGSNVTAVAINHTAIEVKWSRPTLQDMQGAVELYTLVINSSSSYKSLTFQAHENCTVIGDLYPNMKYQLYLQTFNGAHSINGDSVHVQTLDGEPEGISPPEVAVINSTAVRVIWTPPSNPNGIVTEYSIYVNNQIYKAQLKSPNPFVVGDLLPFQVYNIQIEVCTVYTCVKSNGTQTATVENPPRGIPKPEVTVISARSVQIEWGFPEEPNGIILGFDVQRKTLHPCSSAQKFCNHGIKSCFYVKCQKYEDICGDVCYNPIDQECCKGVLHNRLSGYECCGDKYIASSQTFSIICCGDQKYFVQPEHQCCGEYYTRVRAGEVCCYDVLQNRAAVGEGDSCCNAMPFSSSGSQVCCGDALQNNFNQQCCGGMMMANDFICCGDAENGSIYRPSTGMVCCGTKYINGSEFICCLGSNGKFKVHLKPPNQAPLKCCETELISEEKECCNGLGYDPTLYVCSSRVPEEISIEEEKCHSRVLCPISMLFTAYCGHCNFNPDTESCFLRKGSVNQCNNIIKQEDGFCAMEGEDIIYTGDANTFSFTDASVDPFTTYEYRVYTWNSVGHGLSNVSKVTTKQDKPQGVQAPRWTKVDSREDMIFLTWKEPYMSNGIIFYILFRDGTERYKGTEQSFQDRRGISPLKEYTYQLKACTLAGCSLSIKVFAALQQGVPQNVPPPTITPVNSTALHLSWTTPQKPNGIIREYQVILVATGTIYSCSAERKNYTVSGLKPFTSYSLILTACTSNGCNSSEPSSSQTLQDAPEGVWSNPYHVTINESVLELYWSEPETPNGIISQYRLIRNGEVISLRSGEYLNFTDVGLQPNSRYLYQLEASTEAGSTKSGVYVVQTPSETPKKIPVPYKISVLGAFSIYVAWDAPGKICLLCEFDFSRPLEYNILLNTGLPDSQVHQAGREQFIILEDLNAYTEYDVRVQACQDGNCGAGGHISARTDEAPPEELDRPHVVAVGSDIIKINWRPPNKHNGIITSYLIYRRLADHDEEILVHRWLDGILEYTDSLTGLLPHTAYEYCVKAQNHKGSVQSLWSLIYTIEAPPEELEPPSAIVTSAYSIFLTWNPPVYPNGIINYYHVIYQEFPREQNFNPSPKSTLIFPGTTFQTMVFGLLPSTTYGFHIEAFNTASKVSSTSTIAQTMEASPSGLSNFTVEKKDDGKALLLRWKAPERTNGKIQMYNVFCDGNVEYSGLSHQFLFQRLQPYTNYTLVLEACTAAGCTRTFPQLAQTEETFPASQPPPVIHFVNSSHVELYWSPPMYPNGKLKQYNVVKRWSHKNPSANKDSMNENIVFTERHTSSEIFTYVDGGLHPWTNYEYKIRVWNSFGYTDSSWTLVQTTQAAPIHLPPPKVFHVEKIPHRLVIQWSRPGEDNGIILLYRLHRNNITFHFTFDSETFSYIDEGLLAYTEYSYSVTACTLGGCTTSEAAHIKTLEAAPSLVYPPMVKSISSTEINVTWSSPMLQNGEISKYIIQVDKEKYYVGKQLSTLVSNLQPFTQYNISLLACTTGGCTSSLTTSFRTMEAPPLGIKAPLYNVTGPNSINLTWGSPDKPNGQIRSYELRRDDLLIYVGQDTKYHDFGLIPGMEYSYTVQANNNEGNITSPSVKIKTLPSSPSGLEPPEIQAMSAYEILVSWRPPSRPNGDIINFTLSVRGQLEMTIKEYHLSNPFTSQSRHSFIVKELQPYHQYEAKIEACTLLGCTTSEWASGYTKEAPPESQPSPLIDLQGNQREPLLLWNSPSNPNGKILFYELYRRKIPNLKDSAPGELVYNGSSTLFRDINLLPYTEYEYQLWAVNSAGRTPSLWTYCKTGPAPPEGILAPTFDNVTSTHAVAKISPPSTPNGIVTLYRFFSGNSSGPDTVLSEGTSNVQVLYGLRPFTNYSVGSEVCTCLKCCSRGPMVQLTTQPAQPSHQRPPRITHTTSRSASFEWKEPESPNGIIEGYEVHMQTPCPQPAQVVTCVRGAPEIKCRGIEKECNVTDLKPYTHYSVQVISHNAVGSTASEWISCVTHKENPTFNRNIHVSSNITTIFLDWSLSFQLNGDLKEFVLTERGRRLYSGFDSGIYLQRTMDKTLFFEVTCTTDVGTVSSPIFKFNSATGLAPAQPFPSAKNGTEARGNTFYTELWFIILMALLGLLLLAIFLSLVLRKKINKQPYPRERPPLVPVQPRMSPSSAYTQHETYAKHSLSDSQHVFLPDPILKAPTASPEGENEEKCDLVADVSGSTNCITLKSYITHSEGIVELKVSELEPNTGPNTPMVVRKASHISHSFSQNSLYRSASQFISPHDKKSLVDGSLWDNTLQGHDSGMYVEDEDLISTIKSFSTVTKHHTAFTDTPL
ncbi:usherin [Xenopus laevis]|uniref:Usherin n=1 Tax=Xenopus laevis TaxID=8355 RepID=A0A8J1KM02_XENLA|nr:usherin [Xenopus laevis]